MSTFKFITEEDLNLREELDLKFSNQGEYILETLRNTLSLSKDHLVISRWKKWVGDKYKTYIEYVDLDRCYYVGFGEGTLRGIEDCYEYNNEFYFPLLNEEDIIEIQNKMVTLISDKSNEDKLARDKYLKDKEAADLKLLEELKAKYEN